MRKDASNGDRIAHDGFRKLPGSATPELGSSTYEHHTNEYTRKPLGVYKDPGAGNVKEIEGAKGNGDDAGGSPVPPPKDVPSAVALSAKHHEETIRFDESHARDHERDAAKHEKALKKLRRRG
jgi:hypothetical protein